MKSPESHWGAGWRVADYTADCVFFWQAVWRTAVIPFNVFTGYPPYQATISRLVWQYRSYPRFPLEKHPARQKLPNELWLSPDCYQRIYSLCGCCENVVKAATPSPDTEQS
jgi:hypothetical protein